MLLVILRVNIIALHHIQVQVERLSSTTCSRCRWRRILLLLVLVGLGDWQVGI